MLAAQSAEELWTGLYTLQPALVLLMLDINDLLKCTVAVSKGIIMNLVQIHK